MKLSIYKATKGEKDPEATLKLMRGGEGESVKLVAVNASTGLRLDSGNLLSVFPDGTVKFHPGIKVPGLPTKLTVRG